MKKNLAHQQWFNACILLLLALLLSCNRGGSSGGSPVPSGITDITITPSEQALSIGETSVFKAYAQHSNQQKTLITQGIQWTSSDSTVATIDKKGKVTANAVGKTNITANYQNKQASSLLTVKKATLKKIVITPDNATFHRNENKPYMATGHYSDNSVEDITQSVMWSSTNPAIIDIDDDGKATAKDTIGSTQIEARKQASQIIGSTHATVISASLQQIYLIPSTLTLHQGEQMPMKAEGSFSDGTTVDITKQIQWTILQDTIATVSTQGIVTGKTQGSTELTASLQSKLAKAPVHVKAAKLTRIKITPEDKHIHLGLNQQYSAIGIFSDGTETPLKTGLTWHSKTPDIVAINRTGLATTLNTGVGKITVTADNQSSISDTTTLTINAPAIQKLIIQPDNVTLHPNMSKQLQAKAIYTDGTHDDITQSATWAAQPDDIVHITATGKITAKAIGTSNITATFEHNKPAVAKINVTQKTLDHLIITPLDASYPAGVKARYQLTGYYSDNSDEDLTANAQWTAAKPAIASIDSEGKLTAHTEGSTLIYASAEGKQAQTNVTVTKAQLERIAITPSSSEIDFIVGEKKNLGAVGFFSDGEAPDMTQQVNWVSLSPTVLSVIPDGDKAGLVTAEGAGSAVITITYPEEPQITAEDTYLIKKATLESIRIAPIDPLIPSGNTLNFSATGYFSDGKSRDISEDVLWTSSEGSIAEIAGNGKVVTKIPGIVTITASLLGIDDSTSLHVVDPSKVKEVIVTPNPATTEPMSNTYFSAKAIFMDNTELDVRKDGYWRSSSNIVTIYNSWIMYYGRAYAWAKGTTTISNTYKGVTGTATLTVK